MKKPKKTGLPLRKIIGICLVLLLIMGIGVMASNTKIYNVKIILSNGYEMDVVTTKTKVSDILAENHIILLPEENVIPNLENELSDNNTIRITTIEYIEEEVEVAETSEKSANTTIDSLLENYNSIVEKIETVQETIPYETITKDVSDGDTNKKDTETTVNIIRTSVSDSSKDFTVYNGKIRKHGQSTLNYPITSLKIWFNKSATNDVNPTVKLSSLQTAMGLNKNRYLLSKVLLKTCNPRPKSELQPALSVFFERMQDSSLFCHLMNKLHFPFFHLLLILLLNLYLYLNHL